MSAQQDPSVSRRNVLKSAGVAAAATAATSVLPPPGAFGATGKRVAVFGAGVAGLTAAHELVERGYQVTVYERSTHFGGKAWSIDVPGSSSGGRSPLPAEHGFRFFPGFYKNLGDTMRRTPTPDGSNAYTQLVEATTYRTSFAGGRNDLTIPFSPFPQGFTPDDFMQSVSAFVQEALLLPPDEAGYFAAKMATYVSSCDERRLGQWEWTSWKDFIREDQMSEEYRTVVSRSLVRNLAATKSDEASTHAIGLAGQATIMSGMGRGNDQNATVDRVLDGPTSEVWLDHWVTHLRSLGVTFQLGTTLTSLNVSGGRIGSATAITPTGSASILADHYVCAVPCERMAPLVSPALTAIDPALARISNIRTDWMNGLVFYLKEQVNLAHGHVNYVHSPFAVTSISQEQFWQRPLTAYGDGMVRESFSTIISDWVTPGILYGKAAKDCTPQEIANEVWAQMKAHLNDTGTVYLRDDLLHSWFLDPAIMNPGTPGVVNDTPLFIQHPGGWFERPDSVTRVPNLFLAGEWVKTNINVTTMDGANQGGRQAARGVLDADNYWGSRPGLWNIYVPPEFGPFREEDRWRYAAGMPNRFDPDQTRPS